MHLFVSITYLWIFSDFLGLQTSFCKKKIAFLPLWAPFLSWTLAGPSVQHSDSAEPDVSEGSQHLPIEHDVLLQISHADPWSDFSWY